MPEITRDTFLTDGQYKKFIKVKEFFERLIELKKSGYFLMVDGEIYNEPYIDGYEIGFKEGNCKIVYVGGTHCTNKKTGEYDIPWIDVSLTELRKKIIPLKRAKI